MIASAAHMAEEDTPAGNGSTMGRAGSSAMQSSVLALNRHYTPIHIFSAPRVFCLLCKGLAEVVHVDEDGKYLSLNFEEWRDHSQLKIELGMRDGTEDWIQAVNFQIEVPRVIRLLKYERVPRNSVKFNRRNIFLRDEHRCQYCGRRFSVQRLSLDHVMPRSRGGPDTWENVVCACLTCNVRKGGRTPIEAGMHLLSDPVKPKRSPLISRHLTLRKYAAWKAFISSVPDGAF